jgi:magnesium transporter
VEARGRWHMRRRGFPSLRAIRSSKALERVLAEEWDAADPVWVVNRDGRLDGVVGLPDLLRADPGGSIGDLREAAPPSVSSETDQEHLALHAIRHGEHAVPLADGQGRLSGVVLPGALLRILRLEHVEDLHRMAGIARERSSPESSLDDPPARRAWHRLPWLVVGLAGSGVATWTMSSYEGALQERIALGFFVPGIVYLADAIGTQSEALAVRALSRSHQPLRKLILRELDTRLLIGVVLALLSFAAVWLGFGSARLALSVGLAVLASGTIAATIGIALPWLLSHAGQDPALGSGPLATIIQDCLSILVYFAIAVRVLD